MGSHLRCSIIPVGIPPGIPPIPPGIPPGIKTGSRVGLAGSHLTFLPGQLYATNQNACIFATKCNEIHSIILFIMDYFVIFVSSPSPYPPNNNNNNYSSVSFLVQLVLVYSMLFLNFLIKAKIKLQ